MQAARAVVHERKDQHNGEPEDGADNHKLGALGAITRMHEIENDKRGFEGGDGQSDDNIISTEVVIRRPNGGGCSSHQNQKDGNVDFRRNDVFGHAVLSPTLLLVPVNQIQQREQIDPHNIDEVPVQPYDFDGRVVLRPVTAAEGSFDEPE
jgi:hypothetical protein